MASNTKQIIIEKVVELSKKKPFNKITINDLCKNCGITRNTFYYYYHDIYDVIINLIQDKIDHIDITQQEKGIFDMIEFLATYRILWINMYKYVDRDLFEGIFKQQIRSFLQKFYNNTIGLNDDNNHYFEIISSFYEESLYGLAVRYIIKTTRDEDYDAKEAFKNVRIIFDGQLELILNNIKKLNNNQ